VANVANAATHAAHDARNATPDEAAMDLTIFTILVQDGVTNGAVYSLLALALVLVFAVTRVIFVPQGELVTYGALTVASLQQRVVPGTVWLLLGAGILTAGVEIVRLVRAGHPRRIPRVLAACVVYPLVVLFVARRMAPMALPMAVQVALMLMIVVPLGPMLYRLAYRPVAGASVLVLLIISIAVHFVLQGLGLVFFGADGSRTDAFTDASFTVGGALISGQSLCVVAASALLIVVLAQFFGRTLYGKALRATAVNRMGARLVGVSSDLAGALTFTVAALIGALSGVLVAPMTALSYDSGFLIGLKGFVAAIIGGLASYPVAAAGAVLVGLMEAFSSFWASAYKEVIVFSLIIPVLLWRSVSHKHVEEEEE
jgi:branched-chain amino acid transport system permease protein